MQKNLKFFLLSFFISLFFWWGINVLERNLEDLFFWKEADIFTAQVSQEKILKEKLAKLKQNKNLKIEAKSALSVLVDFPGQKTVLFEKNRFKKIPIASLTKLMTALVVLEHYDFEEKVVITKKAASLPEVIEVKFKAGEVFKIKDLLHSMLMESSNRAALSLAEIVREKNFIELMNSKAKYLGLKNTHFINPTGLDEADGLNYSTAEDLVKLADYLLAENLLIWEILGKPEFDLYSVEKVYHHRIKNTNLLLKEIPEIIGGKTGQTPQAGGCLLLVLEAPKNKGFLINVILGSRDRFEEMKKIIDWVSI